MHLPICRMHVFMLVLACRCSSIRLFDTGLYIAFVLFSIQARFLVEWKQVGTQDIIISSDRLMIVVIKERRSETTTGKYDPFFCSPSCQCFGISSKGALTDLVQLHTQIKHNKKQKKRYTFLYSMKMRRNSNKTPLWDP
jgi:hypothetical protein